MVTTLRSQSQNIINIAGHFKETQRRAVLEAIINIIVSVVSVYFIGIYGVIIGSIVSTFYRGISVTNYANKNILKYNRNEMARKYIRWIVYCAAFVVISITIRRYIPISVNTYLQWIGIAVPCTIGAVILYGILWALIDREALSDVISIVKPIVKGFGRR
jgi:hypothetical protein